MNAAGQSAPGPRKDGGAANAAGGGNSCGTKSLVGQFHKPGEGGRVLREQLCPGTSRNGNSVRDKFTDTPGHVSGSGRIGPAVPVSVPFEFRWRMKVAACLRFEYLDSGAEERKLPNSQRFSPRLRRRCAPVQADRRVRHQLVEVGPKRKRVYGNLLNTFRSHGRRSRRVSSVRPSVMFSKVEQTDATEDTLHFHEMFVQVNLSNPGFLPVTRGTSPSCGSSIVHSASPRR